MLSKIKKQGICILTTNQNFDINNVLNVVIFFDNLLRMNQVIGILRLA